MMINYKKGRNNTLQVTQKQQLVEATNITAFKNWLILAASSVKYHLSIGSNRCLLANAEDSSDPLGWHQW